MRFIATETDLERVIEPLASYICAAEQPKAALNQALAALFHELEQLNQTAKAHIATRAM